jgi:hypothetical protein
MEQAYSSMPAAKGRIAVLKDQVNACEESFFSIVYNLKIEVLTARHI